jgi:hypothetical protein
LFIIGLDKWIQSDKDRKKEPKEPEVKNSERKEQKTNKKRPRESQKQLSKFTLICSNSKCKYQKVLMKRSLDSRDKICPKCKREMKLKR